MTAYIVALWFAIIGAGILRYAYTHQAGDDPSPLFEAAIGALCVAVAVLIAIIRYSVG